MQQDQFGLHKDSCAQAHPLPTPPPAGCGLARFRHFKTDQTPAGRGLVGGGSRPSSPRAPIPLHAHRYRRRDSRGSRGLARRAAGGLHLHTVAARTRSTSAKALSFSAVVISKPPHQSLVLHGAHAVIDTRAGPG